jgi:hypothetical protein
LEGADAALKAAFEMLEKHALVDEIRDKGFDVTQTNYLLNSRGKMLHALQVYRHAVDLARRSLDKGDDVADVAAGLRDQAVILFGDGWRDLDQVKQSVGINPIPGGLAP